MKQCSRCLQRKPLDDFARSGSGADGRQSYCRRCMADYRRNRNPRQVTEAKTGNVLTAPVRVAVRTSGLSHAEIAFRTGRRERAIRRSLSGPQMLSESASAILDAIGVWPADLGL